jgi:hypothetical protein
MNEMIVLPRQARDKHRGKHSKQKRTFFASQILLNGRDLRDYQPQWLRENISFVTSVKDTYLFSATVKKRHFLRCRLYLKCIILPRQARDKHRESTQKQSGVSIGAREYRVWGRIGLGP